MKQLQKRSRRLAAEISHIVAHPKHLKTRVEQDPRKVELYALMNEFKNPYPTWDIVPAKESPYSNINVGYAIFLTLEENTNEMCGAAPAHLKVTTVTDFPSGRHSSYVELWANPVKAQYDAWMREYHNKFIGGK